MTGVRLIAIPQQLSVGTINVTDSTVPANGMYLSGANTLSWATNSTLALTLSSAGILTAVGNVVGVNAVFSGDLRGGSNGSRVSLRASLLTTISSPADNSIQFGMADVDTAPVAQTLRTQGALAGGTSNVSGANFTLIASPGKGTGTGGSFIFQTAPAGSTGTVVGTPTTALTIDSTQLATFTAGINSVGSHTFTTATSGVVLKRGANGLCGTFVANGITPVTVSNSNVAITDAVIISLNTVGGTVGVQPHIATITGASGFTVVCTATDTSTYNYSIIKNAA